MLSDWYDSNIDNKSKEDIESINKSDFPKLEFQLILGIDDENDLISSFEDILILGGMGTVGAYENEEVVEVTINIKYEVADVQSFLEEFVKLKTSYSDEDQQDVKLLEYKKEFQYRQFLGLFSSKYFILNFYPISRDKPTKEFSLSSLLKVETIEASTVKNDKILSQAYNKIVSTYIKNNDIEEIDGLVKVKEMVDSNIEVLEIAKILTENQELKNLFVEVKNSSKKDINIATNLLLNLKNY